MFNKRFHRKITATIILALLCLFTLSGCSNVEIIIDYTQPTSESPSISNDLEVSFIDVGQADSIFIRFPQGKTMLIDAGNNNDDETVINYIRAISREKIDVVMATHPHEDHIGAMDDIIENFTIDRFYMPRVTTNTKTFKDMLKALENKGLKITEARGGIQIPLDDYAKIEILAPNSDKYESLNDYSAIVKITYGDTSFLFMGDAEKDSEEELLANGYDLRADVLKVGHHGSSSSSTEEFLRAVSPRYAIISVGKDNDYTHPHKETLNRLAKYNAAIFTTADNGTIRITSNGKDITINKVKY